MQLWVPFLTREIEILIIRYLEMAFQMIQGKSWNAHKPHDCFWSSFWVMNKSVRIQLASLHFVVRIIYLLSAPPNWLTASTNRWCNSGVHFSLGFASVERTNPESPCVLPPCRNRCRSIGKAVLVVKSSLGPWCWWYIFCCRMAENFRTMETWRAKKFNQLLTSVLQSLPSSLHLHVGTLVL